MSCMFCKGTMIESFTTHMIETEHCILIVKNVPCYKCRQCGEVAFSSDVIENLDQLVYKLGSILTEVAVVNYQKSA